VLVCVAVVAAAGTAGRVSRQAQAAAVTGPRIEITSFSDESIRDPGWIAAGSDGALWFTNGDSIGRITSRGVVSVYRHKSIRWPAAITAGPDGALWFTNATSIGRITTRGVVTLYKHKSIRSPQGITVGRDGALWFTNSEGNSIGRARSLPGG
jgi:virginiamycin B lyase